MRLCGLAVWIAVLGLLLCGCSYLGYGQRAPAEQGYYESAPPPPTSNPHYQPQARSYCCTCRDNCACGINCVCHAEYCHCPGHEHGYGQTVGGTAPAQQPYYQPQATPPRSTGAQPGSYYDYDRPREPRNPDPYGTGSSPHDPRGRH